MFIAMGELILHHYDKSIEWNGLFIITYNSPLLSYLRNTLCILAFSRWRAKTEGLHPVTRLLLYPHLTPKLFPFGSRWLAFCPETSPKKKYQGSAQLFIEILGDTGLRS
jgi:hypothetical protein